MSIDVMPVVADPALMTGTVLLDVQDLAVDIALGPRLGRRVLDRVSFEVRAGETLAIMGESGAGKTMIALALLGLLPRTARVVSGRALWRGANLLEQTPEELRRVRGKQIGIVFQDPLTSMNPTMRVDLQLTEALLAHPSDFGTVTARGEMATRLEHLGVPSTRLTHFAYPWEWSGGMRQRALIAMAMAHRPALLIADEPTTALDATTQAQVLERLRGIQRKTGTSILLITHDAAVIAEMADRVAVLREGRIVEMGRAADVLLKPTHPYTASLVEAQAPANAEGPPKAGGGTTREEPASSDVLRVENLEVSYRVRGAASKESHIIRAVEDVSFHLKPGETLAVVGESGCGKSTLARSLVGLEPSALGRIHVDGADILRATPRSLQASRRKIQIVFQDPYSSLNPRRRVADSIAEPLRIHGEFERRGRGSLITDLLVRVGLSREHGTRFPHELSGGERQRVAVARALVIEPRIVVLDEPVSALDAPTRAGILRLLATIQASSGVAFVFISHDLRSVRGLAHRVAVMYLGRFVEIGPATRLFEQPTHPYTKALIAAMPAVDPSRRETPRAWLTGEAPDATAPPRGCGFHPRCPSAVERCVRIAPGMVERSTDHASACHLADGLESTAPPPLPHPAEAVR